MHYRNYRLEMDHVEFELMARALSKHMLIGVFVDALKVQTTRKKATKIYFWQPSTPALPSFANLETVGSTRVELRSG